MKTKILLKLILLMMIGSLSFQSLANDATDVIDFINEATAKGLAEIQTGRLALDKSTAPDIKAFAQQMIDDHTQANHMLADIARQKNLEIETEKQLVDKAKAMVLRVRSGESFDLAYVNNQIAAHQQTIELFQRTNSSIRDTDIKDFIATLLPKLQQHLRVAQQLRVPSEGAGEADQELEQQYNETRDGDPVNDRDPNTDRYDN